MSDITLPYPSLTDGTTAFGSQVQADLEAILDVVNSSIDDDNISNDGITASDKVKDGTISAPLLEAGCVRQAAVDWSSTNSGVRAWRTQNHVGTAGGRDIRFEKSITLANVTTEQTFTVDWSAGDGVDGNTTFSATPTVYGLELLDTTSKVSGIAAAVLSYLVVTARSTTGCTVAMRFSTAPAAGSVVLMGCAKGAA
jgi:hypothetical protein